jgi:hypothetical protein
MNSLKRGIKYDGSLIDYRIHYYCSKGINNSIAKV